MTFLSKLGSVLAKVIAIATGIGSLAQPFLGSGKVGTTVNTVVNDLTQIGNTVVTAETLIQGKGLGATKLAAATPLVAQILMTSEMLSGKHIANNALFMQGARKITDGMADILNAIHPDEVKTTGSAGLVPSA